MKIALFDMDGVLLASYGYHRALQDTVRLAAQGLGLMDTTLSLDDIAAFESVGVTSEWDEAAIGLALLQLAAWQDGGAAQADRQRPDFTGPDVSGPDFSGFALSMNREEFQAPGPLERAARAIQPLLAGLEPARREHLLAMIANARQPQASRTHRLFQELVLGSQEYQRLYSLDPEFNIESYLLVHDISHLDARLYAGLDTWLQQPGHAAAIMTSRPNRPPAGLFGTPEAELGAQLVGLSRLPVAGWGGISWLAAEHAIDPQSILKPHAVHALAAVQMALGVDVETALRRAYALSRSAVGDGDGWSSLNGAEILVFEDSPVGLQSGKSAQAVLAAAGVNTSLSLYGISPHPLKQRTLAAAGGEVHKSLAEAFQSAGLV